MGVLLTVAGKPEKKVVFIIEIITDKVLSPGCDLVDQKQLTPLLNKLRATAYHNGCCLIIANYPNIQWHIVNKSSPGPEIWS